VPIVVSSKMLQRPYMLCFQNPTKASYVVFVLRRLLLEAEAVNIPTNRRQLSLALLQTSSVYKALDIWLTTSSSSSPTLSVLHREYQDEDFVRPWLVGPSKSAVSSNMEWSFALFLQLKTLCRRPDGTKRLYQLCEYFWERWGSPRNNPRKNPQQEITVLRSLGDSQ
jgi:hypothetical protein